MSLESNCRVVSIAAKSPPLRKVHYGEKSRPGPAVKCPQPDIRRYTFRQNRHPQFTARLFVEVDGGRFTASLQYVGFEYVNLEQSLL